MQEGAAKMFAVGGQALGQADLVSHLHACQLQGGEVGIHNDQTAQADVVHVVVGVLQGQELKEARHKLQPAVTAALDPANWTGEHNVSTQADH